MKTPPILEAAVDALLAAKPTPRTKQGKKRARLAKKLQLLDLCKMMGWKDPRHALRYYNEKAAQIAKKLYPAT